MYRQKRSIVWQYFEKKTPSTAVCVLCKKEYKNSRNTSNLHDHLKRKHLAVLEINRRPDEEVEPMNVDNDLTVAPGTVQKSQVFRQLTLRTISNDLPQSKIFKLNHLVASMICKDLQTLSMVEDRGFQEFVRELEPRYRLPSRRTLGRTILPQLYAETKNRILQNLEKIKHVAITTDIWTNLHMESFITITVHYCNEHKLQSHILATDILSERHTNEHIAYRIKTILTEWKILNKTVAIVTDNAANMKAAVRHLGYLHLPCAAHTLNLVVTDSLNGVPSVKNLLKTCRYLVGQFKTSVVAAEKLRDIQKQMGLQELKLKQDVPTRWNSSLIMIERLLTLKVPVSAAIASLSRNITALDTEQWETIEDIIPFLKPLEYVTIELSGEKYPTSSKIIPLVKGIQHAIQNIVPKTNAGQALKNNILNNIEIRFEYTETNNITLISTILDPRFKTAAFENENITQAAKDILKSELSFLCRAGANNEVIEDNRENEEQTQENANFWNFFVTKVSHLAKQSTRCTTSSNNSTKVFMYSGNVSTIRKSIFQSWANYDGTKKSSDI